MEDLGFPVAGAGMNKRFDPVSALRGDSPRLRTSRSPTERRCSPQCATSRSRITQLPRLRGHPLDAQRDPGARRRGRRSTAGGDLVIRGVGLRTPAEVTGGTLNVGNAGTLLRLLPGWLAGQTGGTWTLDGDESIRRRPGRPHRRAAARRWAPSVERARRTPAAAPDRRRRPHRDRLRRCRSRARR